MKPKFIIAIATISFTSLSISCLEYKTNPIVEQYAGTCEDGILNLMEDEIDCGGVCPACINPDMLTSPCTDQLNVNTFSGDLNIVFDSLRAFYNDINTELYITAFEGTNVWNIAIQSNGNKLSSNKYIVDYEKNFSKTRAYLKSTFFESYTGQLYVDVWYGKVNIEFCDIGIVENGFVVNNVSGKLFVKVLYN